MICDPTSSPDPLCNARMTEHLDSRRHRKDHQGESWELHFTVQGTNNQCEVEERIFHERIGLPARFADIPFDNHVLRNIGWETWDVVATYAWTGSRQSIGQTIGVTTKGKIIGGAVAPFPENVSYSTRGGRIHLTQSLEHIRRVPTDAPFLDGAINWDGERVKGIDVIAPNLVYSESYMLTRQFIFSGGEKSKMKVWADLTGTVHGNPVDPPTGKPPPTLPDFRYWGIGEVLLDGITMRQTSATLFEVTFEFLVSETKTFKTPVSIDPQQEEIVVEGWNLVWFTYAKVEEDTGNGNEVKTLPKAMYIEQIYERTNFTDLGIGLAAPFVSTDPICTNPDFEAIASGYCGT